MAILVALAAVVYQLVGVVGSGSYFNIFASAAPLSYILRGILWLVIAFLALMLLFGVMHYVTQVVGIRDGARKRIPEFLLKSRAAVGWGLLLLILMLVAEVCDILLGTAGGYGFLVWLLVLCMFSGTALVFIALLSDIYKNGVVRFFVTLSIVFAMGASYLDYYMSSRKTGAILDFQYECVAALKGASADNAMKSSCAELFGFGAAR
ncbi:MAG: hypothetical protein Q4G22_05070 [Paracoccus sp. (in: a-proteobacteria)]|uniref:hypothetical protein n=1 Tax=Paracoccus sp. TaxID=267 RepID=UPI0026E113B7|nr:hypothetical protein [Paracoccus sp. (in: a-proteobacteria)]MDO5631192.1 hypothetical protein [Paracoccus sp. (in: a-proteobacteria)]